MRQKKIRDCDIDLHWLYCYLTRPVQFETILTLHLLAHPELKYKLFLKIEILANWDHFATPSNQQQRILEVFDDQMPPHTQCSSNITEQLKLEDPKTAERGHLTKHH